MDMEYALKTEDIGNSALSEDNTNKPQNDYGSDSVYSDCDRKMVTPQEMRGVMLQMATAEMLRLLTIMLGLQFMIKLMMAMMSMMTMIMSMVVIQKEVTDVMSIMAG